MERASSPGAQPSFARGRGSLSAAGAGVAIFLVTRIAHLIAVATWAAHRHESALAALTKADGIWYLGIASRGYAPPPPIGPNGWYTHTTDLAFFPLYPMAVRIGGWLVPLRAAEVGVTLVAGAVAAGLMAAWAREFAGAKGALVVVAAWSLWPSSAVLSMGYSEALFTACAAGTLLALQRRQWWLALLACVLGGLTRSTGIALVAAVAVAALTVRPRRPAQLVAAVLSPLGLLVSLGHVAVATGRWDGWFWLERTVWRSGFDGGRGTASTLFQILGGGSDLGVPPRAVAALAILGFLALLAWYLVQRPSPVDAAYTLVAGALTLGGINYFHSKPRFLLTVFPPLAAVGRAVDRTSWRLLLPIGLVLLVLSTWWNAWIVVVWRYSL